ncbi:MAG: hypothetical protein IPM48_08230 [Saprospiraceae bacterium]|nr:hypothetical protein [Saprospiraceae bacterium]
MLKRIRFFLGLFIFTEVLSAQSEFQQKLDTSAMLIGDQQWIHQTSSSVDFTQDPLSGLDTLSWMEILEVQAWSKINDQKYVRKIRFTVFDSGTFQILPFPIYYPKDTLTSQPLSLKVFFVQDSTESLRPIKDIIATDKEDQLYLYALFGIILLGIMLFILYKLFKSDERIPEPVVFKTGASADQIALSELNKLLQEKYWQRGQIKRHYDELTRILRSYLSDGFFIPAKESTTSEIVQILEAFEPSLQQLEQFEKIFQMADLVKFGNHQPEIQVHSDLISLSEHFVKSNSLFIQDLQEKNKITYAKILGTETAAQFEFPNEVVPLPLVQSYTSGYSELTLISRLIRIQKFEIPIDWVKWHQSKLGLLNRWHAGFVLKNNQWYQTVFIWIPAFMVISIFFPILLLVSLFNKTTLLSGGIFTLSKNKKILLDHSKLR